MNVYLYFTGMEVDYPETINGVCVKVEPRSPTTVTRPGSRYDDFTRQKSSPFENSASNGYQSVDFYNRKGSSDMKENNYNGQHTSSYSQSPSDFSEHVQSSAFNARRKSSSPAFSEEMRTQMSQEETNYNTSTPSFKSEKNTPRVSTSYHLSKGTPPSMLGDSIYSYASFNESSYSKMNMILKTETNGDSFDTTDSKLNLTYPGTARPIGKKAHLPKRYKCAMCAYKTRYKSDLNRHVRKHAVAGYNCDVCNMPFKTVGNVEFHKRREHADTYVASKQEKKPKFSCKLCSFGTMQSSELTRHVRKHYIAKFTCTLCNRPFMSSGSLLHHKKQVHKINDENMHLGSDDAHSVDDTGNVQTDSLVESDEDNYNQTATNQKQTQAENTENGFRSERECENTTGNVDMDSLSETIATVAANGDVSSDETILENKAGEVLDRIPITKLSNEVQDEVKGNEVIAKHKCQFCNKSFGRKQVLDCHLKNIHKMKIKEDESAFLEYDDDYDLALDMSIQELENCDSSNYDQNVIVERQDFKNMRHQCPFCAYATNYKSTYDRHVKKHDLECHICHVCRMPFITFGHMQRHIRDNHPEHHQNFSNKVVTDKDIVLSRETHGVNKPPLKMSIKRDVDRPFQSGVANYQAVSVNRNPKDHSNFIPVDMSSKRKKKIPIQRHLEQGVTVEPPVTGRYAKLVSDFDDFALRPFACALCFFRTGNVDELLKHTQNHLTGCNPQPVPDTARFNTAVVQQNQRKISPKIERTENPIIQQNLHPYRRPNNKLQDVISKLWNDPKPIQRPVEEEPDEENANNFSDSIVPTFSVHYRKDKTNLTRPYLCLLCRKRFRLLTILKQHFRQTHSESQINTKSYTCGTCGDVFNSPVLLQEHHDVHHKIS